jgi:hypothetical protein
MNYCYICGKNVSTGAKKCKYGYYHASCKKSHDKWKKGVVAKAKKMPWQGTWSKKRKVTTKKKVCRRK